MLDIPTLLIINAANVLLLALTLPFIMGQQLSAAAFDARRSLVVQAFGWVALIASKWWVEQWQDRLLSTLSMAGIAAGVWLMYQALQGWLGPRPLRRTMLALALLMPLGYGLSFDSYPVRVGWSNFLLAAQLLILARAALWPHSGLGGRWRWVVFGCVLVMSALTATRGLLGAFFTHLYPTFETPHPANVAAMLASNVSLLLMNVSVLVAWREEAEQQLRAQAMTDPLTGLLNRRGWDERASALLAQGLRHHLPLALLMLDLDHFKRINDSHGHEGGDAALRLFGATLLQTRRLSDVVARIGGEEFAVLLPHADRAAACVFDQRLRASLAEQAQPALGFGLDFSSGLALLTELQGETLAQWMTRADSALYQAKSQGRGRLMSD